MELILERRPVDENLEGYVLAPAKPGTMEKGKG